MSKFTDKESMEWYIDLNVGLIEDLKEATSIDLDEILTKPENIATFLFAEPKKLVGALYVLCRVQCEQNDISPKQFGYRFDRDALDRASNALIESMLTFYPRASAGRVLVEELPALLKKMDEKIGEQAKKSLSEALSNTPMS
jgi:hypothetical protein